MDPNNENENSEIVFELTDEESIDESASVDDFIRELEAKEKDLHITAETTFIELAADFEEDEIPDFMLQDLSVKEGQKTVKLPPVGDSDGTRSAEQKRLEGEVTSLRSKIASLEEERTELYKNSQRRLKDFEAYKARTERERKETFQRQLSNLASQMLPALDNLDRALQCASDLPAEKQGAFAQFFDGIVLVNQQVNEVLVGMGIEPIATIGYPFDPNLHEAVAVDESSDLPPNTVTAELLRGFRIGDNVIRHSMVRVSKGAAAEEPVSLEPVPESDPVDDDNGPAGSEIEQSESEAATRELEWIENEDVNENEDVYNQDLEDESKGFSIERNGEVTEQ